MKLISESIRRGFQNDTLKSLCDWLMLSQSLFGWLTAHFGKHQFETPSKFEGFTLKRLKKLVGA